MESTIQLTRMLGMFSGVGLWLACMSHSALAGGYINSAGSNAFGQCAKSPVDPSALPALMGNARMAAGGAYHTLVLKIDGTVWAWGDNTSGVLGDGSTTRKLIPVRVPLSSVIAIAAGLHHSMALTADGAVWTWGDNECGQLGTSGTCRTSPSPVPGLPAIVSIAAPCGGKSSFAVDTEGKAWAWGENTYGQLGDGTKVNRPAPVQIASLTNVSRICSAVSGQYTFAIRADRTGWAWGRNNNGQLGTGTKIDSLTPIQIPGLAEVVDIGASSEASVAIKSDHTLWRWGCSAVGLVPVRVEGLSYSVQLSNDGLRVLREDHTVYTVPGGMPELENVNSVWASQSATYGIGADGQLWSWGNNDAGQLGRGVTADSCLATLAPVGGSQYVSAAAGSTHSLVINPDKTVSAWGDNKWSNLGTGTSESVLYHPVRIPDFANVLFVSAGNRCSFAIQTDHTLWAWGNNAFGVLGLGDGVSVATAPVQISTLSGVTSVSAGRGSYHCLAATSDGKAWSWGTNSYGQLGDGTITNRSVPGQVPGLSNVIGVAAGYSHSLAVTGDGRVWAWGSNILWELGDGTYTNRSTPVLVPELTGIVSVAAGWGFSLALGSDGTVWGWGRGYQTNGVPARVIVTTNATAIAAGLWHGLALKADGTAWAWGANKNGQLGDGTIEDRSTPVRVKGLSGVESLAAGDTHSLFIGPPYNLPPEVVGTWPTNHGELGGSCIVVAFDQSVLISVDSLSISAGYIDPPLIGSGNNNTYRFNVGGLSMGETTATLSSEIKSWSEQPLVPYTWTFRRSFTGLDGDIDVDTNEVSIFVSCISGPGVAHSGTPACTLADLDADSDVDQDDFAILQRCLSVEGFAPEPECTE